MVKYNPDIHHRQSIRLRGYDYSQPGAYFVTICTHERECCLGDLVNGEMRLTVRGAIAFRFWLQIPDHFPNVQLDEFVIMPNHCHGIIIITDQVSGGGQGDISRGGQGDISRGGQGDISRGGQGGETLGGETLGGETLGGETPPLRGDKKPTLGQIIAYYKYQTTKIINQIDDTPGLRVWQRNYYDRIIRNPNKLNLVRQYIITNPIRWHKDPNNPRRGGVSPPCDPNGKLPAL